MNEELVARLRSMGVPDPDGTALGDALHTLAVHSASSDDAVVLLATRDIYDDGAVTGISFGDLRELIDLARVGAEVLEALHRARAPKSVGLAG